MEHAISSLAYKGSIVEAIAEAKRQKKLFVVYISGDNAESTQLEESIWINSSVAESISKYCILLHISEGSTDATNFSVIYPQKSAPCITAIGYNGVNLWQNEGFVGADVLASSLEKAWLSLHIQETTATFLTAAFASKKSETHGTNSSETVSFEQGSSSSVDVLSPSTDKQAPYSEARVAVCSEMESKGSDHANEEINSKLGDAASPGSVLANTLEGSEVEQATSSIETTKESLRFVKVDHSAGGDLNVVDRHSEVTTETSQVIANEATEAVQQKNSEVIENYKIDSEVTTVTSQVIANEATEAVQQKNSEAIENYKIDSEVTVVANKETEAVQDKKADAVDKDKIHVLESCLSKPTDVHLNIRLLDGANLQEKFLLTNTLRMVKDYVDRNQASAIGSYDLGIPYPRKVFTDQDLSETLAELGLVGRQALIIVPRHQVTGYYRGGSSSHNQKNSTTDLASSNGNNEGYLGLTKRILSYLNPFSYLGGGANSSNSAQESQDRLWQYVGPNPALQNNQRGAGTTPSVYSSNQSDLVTGRNNNSSKKAPTSRLGSNIHTLKHDEDDGRFSERNAFWNGNSTEYGGDNDGK